MSSKYKDFFETSLKKDAKESEKNKRPLSFSDTHTLPKNLRSREAIEKDFKEYLSNRETQEDEQYERRYISPPFEVSQVASPVYGYNRPSKSNKKQTNYFKLKKDMVKKPADFILYEEDLTNETAPSVNHSYPEKEQARIEQVKKKSKPHRRKAYGLHRTLSSIIEEEKSGNNGDKSEVPGLFLPKNKG